MQLSLTPAEIAGIVQSQGSRGSTPETLRGIAGLEQAQPGDISFLGNPKYKTQVAGTRASLVLLPPDYPGEPGPRQQFLLVENPSAALARLCSRLEQLLWPKPAAGVHPTAVVSPGARIAASATVGPLCIVGDRAVIGERCHLEARVFVGHGARTGDDCWLMPGSTLGAECMLGNRVRLHPGVVIGADGFGYEFVGGRHEKVPQVGNVEIGDDVEIGANSTVDRARFSRTLIGEGTKIDNLVQVGHNSTIGRHCILCAQVALAGSVTLEDFVVIGGQAAVGGHLTVGKGARIGGQAGVGSDVAPGTSVTGTLAIPMMREQRIQLLRRRLPELFRRVDALEKNSKKSSAP